MKKSFVLAAVFVAGCVTATVANQALVPPARAAEGVQKWEYTCGSIEKLLGEGLRTNPEATLNRFGREGWRLVPLGLRGRPNGIGSDGPTSLHHYHCMERPLPD